MRSLMVMSTITCVIAVMVFSLSNIFESENGQDLFSANVVALTNGEESETGQNCRTVLDQVTYTMPCNGVTKVVSIEIIHTCVGQDKGSCMSGSIHTFFDCEGYMQSTNDYTRVIVCG